jgi:serine-type D-Ala-D-Ala carboxypeptidase (penicillin-binding protein 5/6)
VKKFLLYFLLLLSFFSAALFFYYYHDVKQNKVLASPLPEFLSKKENSEVSSLDMWLPTLFGFFDSGTTTPMLSAKSALVYDLTSEKTIYEKNPEEKLPMASITKLMTAIVAIDHKKKNNRYEVYPDALVGENVMGLSEGEVMSLEELLYGVFMYSGNDAAETLALNTMPRDEFIKTMNQKAKAIGMKNTNFTNPTGLEGDGNQHTTAYDLLVLSKYAITNYPQIVKASSAPEHFIEETEDHNAYELYNQLNLVTTYPGVKGLKDGYTPEAGLCLITYLDYEGHQIIGIILGSENRRAEMKDLLDYSLNTLGVPPPPHS